MPPSGKFVLRIDPGLHEALREEAKGAGVSLNEYCARKLAAPTSRLEPPIPELLERAERQFAGQLVGLIGFGSWARDAMTAASDVDVLVVVEEPVEVTRALYHPWDAQPLRWRTHLLEPHIVRMPGAGARVSGVWAEAAVDGVVLYDRDLRVSKRLVEIRHRILAGEIVRRSVHGQSYWVEAA